MITHTVKAGDTLSTIAARYGTTVDAIMSLNQGAIKDKNVIYTGQVINVKEETPAPPVTVKTDDVKTLFSNCVTDIENLASFKALMAVMK